MWRTSLSPARASSASRARPHPHLLIAVGVSEVRLKPWLGQRLEASRRVRRVCTGSGLHGREGDYARVLSCHTPPGASPDSSVMPLGADIVFGPERRRPGSPAIRQATGPTSSSACRGGSGHRSRRTNRPGQAGHGSLSLVRGTNLAPVIVRQATASVHCLFVGTTRWAERTARGGLNSAAGTGRDLAKMVT